MLDVLYLLQVWHRDDRRAQIEAYTHWGIIGFAMLLVSTALKMCSGKHACSVSASPMSGVLSRSRQCYSARSISCSLFISADVHHSSANGAHNVVLDEACMVAGAGGTVEQQVLHASTACHLGSDAGGSFICSQSERLHAAGV